MTERTPPAIDRLLGTTRQRISRVGPRQAFELAGAGGLLVDTRPVEVRRRYGEIPGALVIDRNVLEWRLDPTSPSRHPAVVSADVPIVVFCQESYASSLAVESLARLGLTAVHDLAGGYAAWEAAGLPVTPSVAPAAGTAERGG